MLAGLIQAAGGLGFFLLGMSVMTDGLKSLADERLRSLLARSTKSPVSGVCTGAATTAVLQSSSATTVAAVGFVHAGLLTFSQALGVIFGANIGTTIKGWLVALIGFKLKLGEVMMPLILCGVLLRLTGKKRVQLTGTVLAGFGLIFVGISTLQLGMSGFEGIVTPDSFPPDTIEGRLLLMLIGAGITVITQSSSAGVAAALAAVHAGTISLPQAAAMVIGMDVGTTVTAAIATIGASVQARRTGFAHVIYNWMTAVGAFLILTPYLTLLDRMLPGTTPEFALVGFHTLFNTLGVIAILPFTHSFARLIERLFPERGNPLVKRLDSSLIQSPDVALHAVMATLQDIMQSMSRFLLSRLSDHHSEGHVEGLNELDDAIDQTRNYLEQLRIETDSPEMLERYSSAVHILDHLHRVAVRLHDSKRLGRVRNDEKLSAMTDQLIVAIESTIEAEFPVSADRAQTLHEINRDLKAEMREYRIHVLRRTASGRLSTETALNRTDTARWIRRVGYHLWRISDHASADPPRRSEAENKIATLPPKAVKVRTQL